jgi:hypothetical protein
MFTSNDIENVICTPCFVATPTCKIQSRSIGHGDKISLILAVNREGILTSASHNDSIVVDIVISVLSGRISKEGRQ